MQRRPGKAGWRRRNRFNPHSSFHPSATTQDYHKSLVGNKFQSSLELSPECNHEPDVYLRSWRWFQSSLELSPECNVDERTWEGKNGTFQSSLELSPECNVGGVLELKLLDDVSILTRAFTRVQHQRSHRGVAGQFVSILTRAFTRVQPRTVRSAIASAEVSILTRAFTRVQPPPVLLAVKVQQVSILTRAFTRVQQGSPLGLVAV